MTISFYCPLKGDFNGRFWAMWAKIVRSDFFSNSKYKKFHSKERNIKLSEKLNYGKNLAYLFCTTLSNKIRT